MGHRDEALARSRAAAQVFRRRGEPAWHRRAVLAELMARAAAVRGPNALWEAARADGDRLVAAQAAAAGLRAPGPHPASMGDLTADAMWLSRSPVVSLRMAGLVALATDAARRGDDEEARRMPPSCQRDPGAGRSSGLASLDLRTATALHGEAAAALDLDLAAPRGPSALVEVSERWRAATRPTPRLRPGTGPSGWWRPPPSCGACAPSSTPPGRMPRLPPAPSSPRSASSGPSPGERSAQLPPTALALRPADAEERRARPRAAAWW